MRFVVNSNYDRGDEVYMNNGELAKVKKVTMHYFNNVVKFFYLLEFENGSRQWKEEHNIYNQKG